jgi:hypothetical protein
MKRARDSDAAVDELREPVVVREVSMHEVDAMCAYQLAQRCDAPRERDRILRFTDRRVCELERPQFLLELVSADVCVMSVDPRSAKRFDFREGWSGGASPAVSGGQMKDSHE